MATYHQYSEIVAAYGYRLPPPPPPQTSRVGLALLYAAVGVALGTFTGTALAVATLPPDASMLTGHLTFAKAIQSDLHIHAIHNAGQSPVIQNHAAPMVNAAAAPQAPAPAVQTASASGVIDHSANPGAAPALFVHQAPALPNHVNSQLASAAPAPVQSNHFAESHENLSAIAEPTFLIHQAPILHLHAFNPPAVSVPATPVILSHSLILASNAGQPQILNLAPIDHAAPAVHAPTLKLTPGSSSAVQVTAAEPTNIPAQPVQKQASSDNIRVAAAPSASPLAVSAQPPSPSASSAAAPAASLSAGLDSGFKPLSFYSEGDATVVSYDAAGDTITTDDGKTFEIGATVNESHAQSWQEYRSNVHYRCDQNGSCSLVRIGVIALNARLM